MNKQAITSRHQSSIWLHLFFVAGVVLYLYSPFIDHWFGLDTQSRPHTHVAVPTFYQMPFDHEHEEHVESESPFLCSLNIDAVLTLLLGFYSNTTSAVTEPQGTLSFAWDTSYITVAAVFPTVITPPPNLL